MSHPVTMRTHTLLTCQAQHCGGYVFGGSGEWEIVRKLGKREHAAAGHSFGWCKACGIKYELRQVVRGAA